MLSMITMLDSKFPVNALFNAITLVASTTQSKATLRDLVVRCVALVAATALKQVRLCSRVE